MDELKTLLSRSVIQPHHALQLRRLILVEPCESTNGKDLLQEKVMKGENLTLRAKAWMHLLGVGRLDQEYYMGLVQKGESRYGAKIRNDTFRTFKNCTEFEARVRESKLIRVLNAFINSEEGESFLYVQGMNVLCGIFLYVMPELEAFYCFRALITNHLGGYITKNLDGLVRSCHLLEQCIETVDPVLSTWLKNEMKTQARIYAFAPLLTLSACCAPLNEIVKLWDIYLAAGVHLNIVFYASQLILMRSDLMNPELPARKCLSGRDFPKINAKRLTQVAMPVLMRLDPAFVEKLKSPFLVQ